MSGGKGHGEGTIIKREEGVTWQKNCPACRCLGRKPCVLCSAVGLVTRFRVRDGDLEWLVRETFGSRNILF